jgi:hypothetical protein
MIDWPTRKVGVPKKAREILRFSSEPVVSERRFQMSVRQVKLAQALVRLLAHAHWPLPSP